MKQARQVRGVYVKPGGEVSLAESGRFRRRFERGKYRANPGLAGNSTCAKGPLEEVTRVRSQVGRRDC